MVILTSYGFVLSLGLFLWIREEVNFGFVMGFPVGSDSKESACQCRRHEIYPWVGKILWRRELLFLPGEFHGQRSLVGGSPWGHKELDTTKQLTHTHTWELEVKARMPFSYHHIKKKISVFQRLYYLERSMGSWKRRIFTSVYINIIPNKIFHVEIFEPSFIRHYIPCLEFMAQCSVHQLLCTWIHLGLHGLSRSLRRPTLVST